MNGSQNRLVLLSRTGDRILGIPIDTIREVLPAFEVLHTPGLPGSLAGLISLRGEILPVIDGALLLGLPRTRLRPAHRFLVVRGGEKLFAILVEHIDDLVETSESPFMEHELPTPGGACIDTVIMHNDAMVLILNIDRLLESGQSLETKRVFGTDGARVTDRSREAGAQQVDCSLLPMPAERRETLP